MKALWKRMGNLLLTVFCALTFAFVGVNWLMDARTADGRTDGFTVFLALIWLIGAAIWTVRAVREYRRLPKPEREVADAAVNALLCLTTSILWLRQFELGWLASLVWAIAAIAWTVRAVRRYREWQKENEQIAL